jgi:hypothetical protein
MNWSSFAFVAIYHANSTREQLKVTTSCGLKDLINRESFSSFLGFAVILH